MAKKILVIFAHPALEKSRVHKQAIQEIEAIEGLTFHDLYEAYPNFEVDVNYEKQLLLKHDIIVFQHPLFWYSVPALIKEWIDLVLEHGWAYGHEGSALRNKYWLHVVSSGGREEAYSRDSFFKHTVREFLAPMEYTAKLCKMKFLAPYVIHGTHVMKPQDIPGEIVALHRFYQHLIGDEWDYQEYKSVDNIYPLFNFKNTTLKEP